MSDVEVEVIYNITEDNPVDFNIERIVIAYTNYELALDKYKKLLNGEKRYSIVETKLVRVRQTEPTTVEITNEVS